MIRILKDLANFSQDDSFEWSAIFRIDIWAKTWPWWCHSFGHRKELAESVPKTYKFLLNISFWWHSLGIMWWFLRISWLISPKSMRSNGPRFCLTLSLPGLAGKSFVANRDELRIFQVCTEISEQSSIVAFAIDSERQKRKQETDCNWPRSEQTSYVYLYYIFLAPLLWKHHIKHKSFMLLFETIFHLGHMRQHMAQIDLLTLRLPRAAKNRYSGQIRWVQMVHDLQWAISAPLRSINNKIFSMKRPCYIFISFVIGNIWQHSLGNMWKSIKIFFL